MVRGDKSSSSGKAPLILNHSYLISWYFCDSLEWLKSLIMDQGIIQFLALNFARGRRSHGCGILFCSLIIFLSDFFLLFLADWVLHQNWRLNWICCDFIESFLIPCDWIYVFFDVDDSYFDRLWWDCEDGGEELYDGFLCSLWTQNMNSSKHLKCGTLTWDRVRCERRTVWVPPEMFKLFSSLRISFCGKIWKLSKVEFPSEISKRKTTKVFKSKISLFVRIVQKS